jgi:tetratricopeptide (TPR) repeat protein
VATRKRRHHPESAADTLEAIESWGDRAARWIGEHPLPILGTAVAILLIAGVIGLTRDTLTADASESAAALARVQHDYRIAMGGTPGSIEVPEPANPETARRIRRDTIAEYEQVAAEHAGTTAGALALLEAAKLQQQLGEPDAAIETYERGLDSVGADEPVRAFLLTRLASVHESAGRYAAAAQTYEQAARVPGYALRYDALADAARNHAQAGDAERALAAQDRIASEAPDMKLPPYVEARLSELRRRQRLEGETERP